MISTRDAVIRFLAGVGRPSEAEFYLKYFRAQGSDSFALIAPDDGVRQDAAEALALDLRYLRQLGLEPPVARRGEDVAVRAAELGTRKVVLLRLSGGLAPQGGPPASYIDITTEYEQFMADGVLGEAERAVLQEARRLIEAVEQPMSVAVTSPLDLLRELFTVRGAGTLVRRGANIARHDSLATVDRERLRDVLTSAFGAEPRPELFERPIQRAYVAGDYAGAALVEPSPHGPYLGKFAVGRAARGEGIGRDLWRALEADCPTIFWRARPSNPINGWYRDHCDGMAREGTWWIFWRGLATDRIAEAIAFAAGAPLDFPP